MFAPGENESTLGADARAVAAQQGLKMAPDPLPDRNVFIRTDQFSFVREGIPALAFKFGFAKDTPEFAIEHDWRANRYHAPSDDLAAAGDEGRGGEAGCLCRGAGGARRQCDGAAGLAARQHLRQAVTAHPRALLDRAVAAQKAGDLTTAEALYRELVDATPVPEILVNYGNVLGRHGPARRGAGAAMTRRWRRPAAAAGHCSIAATLLLELGGPMRRRAKL